MMSSFRCFGNLVRKLTKNPRATPHSVPEAIVGLLIDLLKQPRPYIPAKLVRRATAAPKFFFQRMSLEISCSPKTGPVRHLNCASKKLAGIPLRAYELYSRAEAVLLGTKASSNSTKKPNVLRTAWSDLIISGYGQRAS